MNTFPLTPASMPPPQTLLAGLLQALQALYPPTLVVHIGAGRGQGELQVWRNWGVPQALIIDADEKRLDWATSQTLPNHWQAVVAVLSSKAAQATYHLASNPDEDGLVAPENLNALWPNLRAIQVEMRDTRTLDDLLEQAQLPVLEAPSAWLLVDCLPALQILQGSQSTLLQAQVVCVRVAQLSCAVAVCDLRQDAITAYLEPLGLVPVAQVQSNHPALSHVLYARHPESQLTQLKEHAHALSADNDRLNQVNADSVAACGAETEAHIVATAQRDALSAEKEVLTVALEQQLHLATERQTSLVELQATGAQLGLENKKLIAAQADTAKASAELAKKLDLEAKAKLATTAQRDALSAEKEVLTVALEQQLHLATERQTSLVELQATGVQLGLENKKLIAAQADTAKASAELAKKLDLEVKAKLAVTAQRDALSGEKEVLTVALEQQLHLATERQTSLIELQAAGAQLGLENKKLIAAQADTAKASVELVKKLDLEVKAKLATTAQRDALSAEKEVLTVALEQQLHLATERQTSLVELQATGAQLGLENKKLIAAQADTAKASAELVKKLDLEVKAKLEATAQRDALSAEKEVLTVALEQQLHLATERQTSLVELQAAGAQLGLENKKLIAAQADTAKASVELVKKLDLEVKAKLEATAQRDAEAKAKTDALAQRDAEAKVKKDVSVQRDALTKDKASLTAARDEQTALATTHQKSLLVQQQNATVLQQRNHQLETDNQESAIRQQLLQEELIRAEAQIELIKDLLLREPGL